MTKALVVAPEEETRDLVEEAFRQEGFEVELARPNRLSDLVAQSAADVLLVDIKMPGIDGIALLRALKHRSPAVHVIMLESKMVPEDVHREAIRLGASVFPAVPFERDRFLRHLRYLRNAIAHGRKVENSSGDRLSVAEELRRHVVPEIHDPDTGRLDAKRTAEYLHVSLSALAEAIGKNVAAVHKSPAALSLQENLAPIARTIAILAFLLRSREQVLTWLNSPHPDLGNRSPLSLMLAGKASSVMELLDATLAGQPS